MKAANKRILIIDSDSTAVYELFAVFVRQGYEIETSQCVREAAQRIKDVKFGCIILDVNMPKMKGYDAVSIIKAIDPKTQIIMTSQDNNMDLEAQVREQDIFYYYIKSFDIEELIEAVRDVFQKQKKV